MHEDNIVSNYKLVPALKQDAKRLYSFNKGEILRSLFHLFFNFKFIWLFWFRVGNALWNKKSIISKVVLIPIKIIHSVNQIITGIQIPIGTQIEGGLKFAHYSCIVIAGGSKIGHNCTLHQGVTIGRNFGGEKNGCPHLGNNIVIFPNAVICGNVKIGDNANIGAGSVVVGDVPPNTFVAGNPAKVISVAARSTIDDNWINYLYGY